MDPRLIAHFYAEAEGVHRQNSARLARAVAAGFSDRAGFQQFIQELELERSSQVNYDDTWEMLKAIGTVRKKK